MQLVASFVQINPPCSLCKTDPLSASELSGKVEDALAGRSPLFSSLLHRLYKMARSGFSLCKKTQNTLFRWQSVRYDLLKSVLLINGRVMGILSGSRSSNKAKSVICCKRGPLWLI